MIKLGLVVPVMYNFKGLAELMESVDYPVMPYVIDNWTENRGVAVAWNIGVRKAIADGCNRVLICNDDVVLHPGTIQKMLDSLSVYDFITGIDSTAKDAGEVAYSLEANFACFMMRPNKVTSEIGWFDEHFKPAYFEDNDYAYRLKLAGLGHTCRQDALFDHKGSVTQRWEGQMTVSSMRFCFNRSYFIGKWGGMPLQETYTHPFNNEAVSIDKW